MVFGQIRNSTYEKEYPGILEPAPRKNTQKKKASSYIKYDAYKYD